MLIVGINNFLQERPWLRTRLRVLPVMVIRTVLKLDMWFRLQLLSQLNTSIGWRIPSFSSSGTNTTRQMRAWILQPWRLQPAKSLKALALIHIKYHKVREYALYIASRSDPNMSCLGGYNQVSYCVTPWFYSNLFVGFSFNIWEW